MQSGFVQWLNTFRKESSITMNRKNHRISRFVSRFCLFPILEAIRAETEEGKHCSDHPGFLECFHNTFFCYTIFSIPIGLHLSLLLADKGRTIFLLPLWLSLVLTGVIAQGMRNALKDRTVSRYRSLLGTTRMSRLSHFYKRFRTIQKVSFAIGLLTYILSIDLIRNQFIR